MLTELMEQYEKENGKSALNGWDGTIEPAYIIWLEAQLTAIRSDLSLALQGSDPIKHSIVDALDGFADFEGLSPSFLNYLQVIRKMKKELTTLNSRLNPVNIGKMSDGYHTFEELYMHRTNLFAVICRQNPDCSFIAKKHEDGSMYEGMFLAGIRTPQGYYSYHCGNEYWPLFNGVKELEFAPPYDGHKPSDIGRLFTIRCGTEWHTGFPEQNGIYVVEVEEEPDKIKIATYIKELGWMNRYYDDVIRWAYIPQEEQ